MALALVTTDKDLTRRRKHLTISATPSGSYATGGDTLNLTLVSNPKFLSNGKISAIPKSFEIINSPTGYTGEVIAGTTLANYKLKVYTTAGAELPAAAYPAALIADPFLIEFSGPLGNF